MPCQILTLRLDGISAGDYIAHVADPEPPALGLGLRSVTLRAEPRGGTVQAILVWDDCAPAPRVAAQAAGLPLIAEVASVEVEPAPDAREERPRRPERLTVLERAAARTAGRSWAPSIAPPAQLRWA